jgi:hypothetical protein
MGALVDPHPDLDDRLFVAGALLAAFTRIYALDPLPKPAD